MSAKKLSVREICFIGIFAAIISVLGQISVPMPYGVPMTLQTLVIPLAGVILGTRNGTFAVLVYVLLGAIGVPVFAGFTGGFGVVLGPTGGFILSFPIMAMTAGIGAGRNNKIWLVSGLVVGSTLNFICGMLVFSFVMSYDMHTAFAYSVLPFIPTAIIKIVLVALLGESIKAVLVKGRVPA